MAKFFRTIFGILLIPAALGVGQAFYSEIREISLFSGTLHILERGVLAYLLLHVFLVKPIYLYVLGHESVHVLAAWLCGGHVVSFNVTPSGGNVETSKTNFFIELAPYFVPIYTLLSGVAYVVLRSLGREGPAVSAVFLFLIGFTLAFHFVMTTEVLKLKQPDIMKSGIIFSSIIIFTLNLLVVILVFSPVFDLSLGGFFEGAYTNTAELYRKIYSKAVMIANGELFW
ncbi:MAG: hypothetical protein GF408_03685 [Candidatus Omnitrophica bacterium]|nr:hypothetical protein [Candidatus Omnitrophota bacterium]